MKTAALITFAAFLSACSQLGINSSGEASGGATAKPDVQLLRDLSQANLAEIATGKLAVSKAQSSAVRQFGQNMIDEHTKMQAEGARLAQAKGMPVPGSPDLRHQAAAKKLDLMSGNNFDRAYMEQMVKDHGDTLELLQRAATQASDTALRSLAETAIPYVRQHLQMAQRLTGDLVGSAR
jgi:putative membrane protein